MRITLREIDADNWRQVAALRIGDTQADFVAPNLHSLAEAKYGISSELAHLRLVPLAIYSGEELVGFVMYNTNPEGDRFFIMRLMVDARHQRKGYGRAALEILLDRFVANPQAKEIAISYEIGNEAARRLYAGLGFVEIGPDNGGILMWLALNPQPEPWESIWNPTSWQR